MKDRYWFEHDSNAHADPKILELRMLYGWAGYGAFWGVVELLRAADGYAIELSRLGAICFNLHIEREWVDSMFALGLLSKDEDQFWSDTLIGRMAKWDEAKRKRAEAGRKGGIAKAKLKRSQSNAKAKPKRSRGIALASTVQYRTEQNNINLAHAREPKQKRDQNQVDYEPKDPTSKKILDLVLEVAGEHWDPMAGPAMVQATRSVYFGADTDTDAVITQIQADLAIRSDIHIGHWADVSRFLNGKFRDYSRRFKVKAESTGGAGEASYKAMKGIVACIERKAQIDPQKLVMAWNTYREDGIEIPFSVRELVDKAEAAGWIESVGQLGKIGALPCWVAPMTATALSETPSDAATADEVAAAMAEYRGGP